MSSKKRKMKNSFYFYKKGDTTMLSGATNAYNLNKRSKKIHNDFVECFNINETDGFGSLERVGINKECYQFDRDQVIKSRS